MWRRLYGALCGGPGNGVQRSVHPEPPAPYRRGGYFKELKIPAGLARHIEKLYVGEELDIYDQITPQWEDLDEYFEDGKAFDITAITEREVRQFPNLKELSFHMPDDPPEELLRQFNQWGIHAPIKFSEE